MEKFIRWLQGLQGEYTSRRDFMVDSILELFNVLPASGEVAAFGAGLPVMTAYLKESTSKGLSEKYQAVNTKTPLFSFIPPTAGMFVWVSLPQIISHGGPLYIHLKQTAQIPCGRYHCAEA